MLEAAKNCNRSPAGRRTLALLVPALLLLALALAPPAPGSAIVSAGASGWVRQDPETPASLCAVAFSDATHGWVVGSSYDLAAFASVGAILATTDGGTTWTGQNVETTATLSAVTFVDAGHGWAVGSGGTIVATTDGGATWRAQSSGTAADLNGVAFPDAAHGWAVGAGGAIVATTDGGGAWSPQTSGTNEDLAGVAFPDATHGWAVSGTWDDAASTYTGTILATANGGATWSTQISGVEGEFTGVAFPDTTHGWAVNFDGAIYATANAGATWRARHLGGGSVHPTAVAFTDAAHGWAVGGTEDKPWGARIWATTNGGATWTLQQRGGGPDEGVNAVAFPDAMHGWVVGNYGAIFATRTGGEPPLTLRLSGLTGGVLARGGRLAASGTVMPAGPAGSTVVLTVQKKRGARWVEVKSVTRALSAAGTYSWTYRPTTKGAYRMRAAIAESATQAAAATTWLAFEVK